MATYTADGEVYDAEDEGYMIHEDEPPMSDRERREREILKIHPFLVNRRVIIKGTSNTSSKGWKNEGHNGKKGKEGKVIEVHSNVTEAVKVQFGDDAHDTHFWDYKDLMMAKYEEEEVPPVQFNPLNLVV